MRKLFALYCLLLPLAVYAQQSDTTRIDSTRTNATSGSPERKARKDTRPFIQRLSLGGSTGFWINTRQTHVEISPMLAYRFPKALTTGIGYRYIYTRDRVYGKNLNTIGPHVFARLQILKRLYLWTEWEHLQTEYAVELLNQEVTTEKTSVNSAFAGLGYIRSLRKNGRGKISVQVLYNFLYDREDESPYYSPVIYRVGYFF
ncbi:MAG TPA: hypothetical protein VGK59_13700 [Ohtaekwangia sp.]